MGTTYVNLGKKYNATILRSPFEVKRIFSKKRTELYRFLMADKWELRFGLRKPRSLRISCSWNSVRIFMGTLLPYVFLNKDSTDKIKRLDKTWKTACQKGGIGVKIFHDLRRTAVRKYGSGGDTGKGCHDDKRP